MSKANIAVHEFQVEIEHPILLPVKTVLNGTTKLTPDFEMNIEDWTETANKGWGSSLATGKKATFETDLVIDYEDETHKKLISNVIMSDAKNHNNWSITFTFPKINPSATTAAKIDFNGVLEVSNVFGGEAKDVSKLTIKMHVSGAPTYTPEVVTKK